MGSLFGLVILFIVRKTSTPFCVPFFFLSVAPMLKGGGYFLVDTFVSKKGDAASLIRLGVPRYIVLCVAILVLLLGVYFLVKNTYRSGISPKDTFIKRSVIFGYGILPYFILSLIYTVIFEPSDTMQSILAIFMVSCFVIFVSLASTKFSNPEKYAESTKIQWRHSIYAAVLGTFSIIVPHLIFSN